MRFRVLLFVLSSAAAWPQSSADRIVGALADRSLAESVSGLKTDDRIGMYSALANSKPDDVHYQALLAGAYIQKTRETADYSYLNRAVAMLSNALSLDAANYEALRLMTETQLERHLFAEAAESSRRLIRIDPADSWNWGTLGDAFVEMGKYEDAAEAYQKMVAIRPDLASYNRAAHFHFLYNDVSGAIEIMKKAIDAGSPSPENVAWCLVDLGNVYFKTDQLDLAQQSFDWALRIFANYHPALAGMGRVLAQRGDFKSAIEVYKQAQAQTPLPDYAAALYDLYRRTGQDALAAKQMDLLEVIDRISRASGEKANRNLVFAFADHDVKLDRALELALGELEFRRDIYSYDALAWALFKKGRLREAQQYMNQALALHTPEPMFRRHAAAIAQATQAAPQEVSQ